MRKMTEEIFFEVAKKYAPKSTFVGNALYIELSDNRVAKIYLYNTFSSDNYDSISMSITDKNKGKIDNILLKFNNLFESPVDLTHPNKISKHVWKTGNEYRWYGKPTKEDLDTLTREMVAYIELFK